VVVIFTTNAFTSKGSLSEPFIICSRTRRHALG
jgi:hypothetical protein